MDIPEIEAQIKEAENKLKKMKMTRESFEKLNDPNLKKLSNYINSVELIACGEIDEILTAQDNYKKETKSFVQYFGEEEKNFKPIDFMKSINEFIKSFKKACL